MQYHGATYAENVWDVFWYEKNIQGDIVAVYNQAGTKLISYTYDAWGNFITTYYNGTSSSSIAAKNPFRYRGYYYDADLSLYYLNTRYYDSIVGRFVSADNSNVLGATPDQLTDKNLYAYCDNNPVMRSDNGGEFWHILAGGVIGGVSSFLATFLTTGSFEEAGVSFLFGAASGALSAAFPGAGLLIELGASAAEEMTMNAIEKNNPRESTTNVAVSVGVDAISSITNSGGSRLTKETMQEYVEAYPRKAKGNHPTVKRTAKKVVRRTNKIMLRET